MDCIEKLYDGAYLIHGVVGGRPLDLPVLIGQDSAVLIDTGCASDCAAVLLPALESLGLTDGQVTHVIITHCDFDHQGGNSAVLSAFPSARLFCGDADRAQIESPELLLRLRYDAYRNDHGIFYDEATCNAIRAELGEARRVDGVFCGGERLPLGEGRELEIVHLPGHSRGHLGVLDRKHRTLFGGDAIHGKVYLDLHGQPALCPTYLYVSAYRETIQRIEQMPLDAYVSCHWPVKRGDEIKSFCHESQSFVEESERRILDYLRDHRDASTLRELCQRVGAQLGDWPAVINLELCYAFAGHLADLAARNVITENRSTKPFTYSL